MTPKTFLLLGLLAALALGACAPSASVELPGTSWTLTSLDGRSEVGSAAGGQDITIDFGQDGRLSGSAGCNGYGGEYSVNGGTIQIGQLISTLMACEPELVMRNESAFLAALSEVTSFTVSGSTLTLSGGGHTLVFAR